jgi:hypothetical protein
MFFNMNVHISIPETSIIADFCRKISQTLFFIDLI